MPANQAERTRADGHGQATIRESVDGLMTAAGLVLFFLATTTTALVATRRHAVPSRLRNQACRMMSNRDLAADFASEVRRRNERGAETSDRADYRGDEQPPPFEGVKEIIIDEDGRPMAIQRRAPPAPATTIEREVNGLLLSPLFSFGALFFLGAVALMLAIAGADAAA